MPYADIEARRAVSRAHYAKNKAAYNPGRKVARAAYKVARKKIIEMSMSRWVSPSEVRCRCEDEVAREYERDEYDGAEQSQWIYDLALELMLRGTAGWLEGGVFLGGSPFLPCSEVASRRVIKQDIGDEWARGEFVKHVPPNRWPDDSIKFELLIFNLTLKRIKLYGR